MLNRLYGCFSVRIALGAKPSLAELTISFCSLLPATTLYAQVAEGLRILVEHQKFANAATSCTLLQLNSTCRTAVQQARGQCSVQLEVGPWLGHQVPPELHKWAGLPKQKLPGQIEKVAGFAAWLPQHAGLVSGLSVSVSRKPDWEQGEYTAWCGTVSSMLAMALELCAARKHLAPAANDSAGSSSANGTGRSPLPLRLKSFGTDCVSPRLLRALGSIDVVGASFRASTAVAGLDQGVSLTPAVCCAFSSLRGLQRLTLTLNDGAGIETPVHFVQALQPLTRLTQLYLPGLAGGAEVYLPTSLQRLLLPYSHAEPVTWDLQHLTNLKDVVVDMSLGTGFRVDNAATLLLQGQLDSLRVVGGVRVLGLERVANLNVTACRPAHLQNLHSVCGQHRPSRLRLCVSYWNKRDHQLSLHEVSALQAAAAAVGASSSLEFLDFDGMSLNMEGVPLCGELAKLPRLQKLSIQKCKVPAEQLLHLTACTSLESLRLGCEGLEDFTAVGLLSKLPRLQHLQLNCCDLQSMAVLGCVGALTDLTVLQLGSWRNDIKMQDHHLQAFLPLRQLRKLALPPLAQCSEAAVADLQACMPCLRTYTNREACI